MGTSTGPPTPEEFKITASPPAARCSRSPRRASLRPSTLFFPSAGVRTANSPGAVFSSVATVTSTGQHWRMDSKVASATAIAARFSGSPRAARWRRSILFVPKSGCQDGKGPLGGLAGSANGDFYGTTQYGGGSNSDGTVFKITPSGSLTTLYAFCPESGCADGIHPEAPPIQANNGDFYGATNNSGQNDVGTIFKITPGGNLTTAVGSGIIFSLKGLGPFVLVKPP